MGTNRTFWETKILDGYTSKPQRGEINIARGIAPGSKPQRGEINIAWGSAPGNPSLGSCVQDSGNL